MIVTIPILCGSVAGKPSGLGVKLHNAGYQALKLPYTYLALGTSDISEALTIAKTLGFRGLGVSMPHKLTVLSHLDSVSDDGRIIGACNTVVFESGRLVGHNTDWIGARDALIEAGVAEPRRALIVGAGGAARAIAYALKQLGAEVFLTARSFERAHTLVSDLSLSGVVAPAEQGDVDADVLINATPDSSSAGPLILDAHQAAQVLFDVDFSLLETPLVRNARSRGLIAVAGWRMLLHQALQQFRLYTEHEPPIDVMARVLEDAFTPRFESSLQKS